MCTEMSRRGKYLTYGIRTTFVLLRVVAADAHISPFSSGAMWASNHTSLMISDTPRISYVKYLTGADKTTRTTNRALRKPDLTVARQGVRTTESGTITRTTERPVFLRVSAISRPQRPFLPYLFPQEGKDMVAEGTVTASL